MFNNSQKGVSLIITFFISIIILFIVLSISTLLYSEIKVIRNMGNSISAFYAADSGIEKALYYDRKQIPEGAVRGICNICSLCDAEDCNSCVPTPLGEGGTGCTECTNCEVKFTTVIDQISSKSYNVVANVSPGLPPSPGQCGLSQGIIKSYGVYKNTTRAINLDIETEIKTGLGPGMDGSGTTFRTVGQNEQIKVSVSSTEPISNPIAYIYYSETGASGTYDLVDQGDLTWVPGHNAWEKTFLEQEIGYYYVTIGAIDANGVCASITVEQS